MNDKTTAEIKQLTSPIKDYLVSHGAAEECANEVAQKAASDMARFVDFAEMLARDHADDYGVLLEFWNGDHKKWEPYELSVECGVLFGFALPYRWCGFCEDGVSRGMFANWDDACWWQEGEDWAFRLGVNEEKPDGDEPVFGVTQGGCSEDGRGYRLRRVPVGPLSENAKKWLIENFR